MEARSQRLPHCVGEGLGAVERLGRGTPGGLEKQGWGRRGEAGRLEWEEGPWGEASGPRSSEPCLWLRHFDLMPGKPGRSGQAAAKPRSEERGARNQEPVERAGLHHPPSPGHPPPPTP